jgi:hypothetical protein
MCSVAMLSGEYPRTGANRGCIGLAVAHHEHGVLLMLFRSFGPRNIETRSNTPKDLVESCGLEQHQLLLTNSVGVSLTQPLPLRCPEFSHFGTDRIERTILMLFGRDSSTVVLPPPFGPMKPSTSPGLIEKPTSISAGWSSYSLAERNDFQQRPCPFVGRKLRGQLFALAVLSSAARMPLASFRASSWAQK